jgi:hypothetical protein
MAGRDAPALHPHLVLAGRGLEDEMTAPAAQTYCGGETRAPVVVLVWLTWCEPGDLISLRTDVCRPSFRISST